MILSYFAFRYYPEKRAAEHFFDALVAGDANTAYQIWKPGASYEMKDFLADWGPEGYYGPVKSYKIMKVTPPVEAPMRWRCKTRNQPVCADAGYSDAGKKPQDEGVERLGADERQVFQFPSIKVQS